MLNHIKQSNYKQIKHTAIDGTLISEGNGQYIYQFTLTEPREPQDDAPLTVANNTTQKNNCTVVTSKGTTITIASDTPLSPNVLRQIDFCDDSTELLKRLQESLKHIDEGHAKLGSKSFGVQQSNNIFNTPTTITFGPISPHQNQMKAAQMALSGEVTYIVGPPGTGKTLTLAAIAFEHIRAGRTVLIAAHTNIAIDNAVMKLCELCKDTGNTPLLEQGFVVRYGAVQKEELKTNERYSEVYLPKIAQRLGKTLHLQKEGLKKSLHNLAKKLSDLQQQQQQNKEQYDSQSTPIKRQLELLQKELAPLEQEERQRVSSLHAQRKQFVLHLQRTEHELTDAQQRLARTKAGIEESRIALVTCRQDEQRWLTQLIDYGVPLCQDTKRGFDKSYFPPFNSCVFNVVRSDLLEIHFGWCLIIKCLMQTVLIIEGEITSYCLTCLARGEVIMKIDLLILDRAPQPFGKNVV